MVPSREVEVHPFGEGILRSFLYKFVTDQGVEYPVLVDVPAVRSCQQRVQLVDAVVVFDGVAGVCHCTAVSVDFAVVGGVGVVTELVFHVQFVVVRAEFGREFHECVSEETLRAFGEQIVVHSPVGVVDPCLAVRVLLVRVAFDVRGDSFHVVAHRSVVDGSRHAGVGGRLLFYLGSHEVTVEASRPVGAELNFGRHFGVVSVHTGSRDDAFLVAVTQRERVVSFVQILGNVDVVAPGNAGVEEILHVVVCFRRCPRVKTGFGTLGHVVLSLTFSHFLGESVVGVAAVCRIVGEVGYFRSPAVAGIRVV